MRPKLVTPLPGPKAKALIERDSRVISTSYTRGYPLVAERGEGAIIEDRFDLAWIDGTSWTVIDYKTDSAD